MNNTNKTFCNLINLHQEITLQKFLTSVINAQKREKWLGKNWRKLTVVFGWLRSHVSHIQECLISNLISSWFSYGYVYCLGMAGPREGTFLYKGVIWGGATNMVSKSFTHYELHLAWFLWSQNPPSECRVWADGFTGSVSVQGFCHFLHFASIRICIRQRQS